MLRRLTGLGLLILVLGISVLASVKSWVETSLDRPLKLPEQSYIFEVAPGDTLSALSRRLTAQGLLDSPYPVLIYNRLSRPGHIMVGEYRVIRGESARSLVKRLIAGDVIKYQVTFPEGRGLQNWLEIINSHEQLGRAGELDMADVEAHFPTPEGNSLEGWFFPDTYVFTKGDSSLAILARAHDAMEQILAQEWGERSEGLPYEGPYEALIMASIIEKETGIPEERAAIAGVFVRRLELGMRLQTDPTVIYGLGRDFDGNLTRQHLREENPYNTYYIAGMPPTPIANPGREAIHAALHPGEGNSLYFVARGDGSHHFSATLEEHREAVRKYQLQRSGDYRSSPR